MKFTKQVINRLRFEFDETDERPEWHGGVRTTVVVTSATAEFDYDTGEMLTLEINGYRKESRGGTPAYPGTPKTHTFAYPARRLPQSLHGLHRDFMARMYEKTEKIMPSYPAN